MNKVFLGGTCAGTTWREELINCMRGTPFEFYNPIVKDWDSTDIVVEELQKTWHCPIHLYVLTSEMKGVYSVAEAIQSSHQASIVTIVHIETSGFEEHQLKSLRATAELLKINGACVTFDGGMNQVAKVLKNLP